MPRRALETTALVSTLVLALGVPVAYARAAGWADALFSEASHDFGPVPRGARVRHTFVLNNRLGEPVNVLDVRASCGCTSGRATVPLVQPGRSSAIEAEMDTRNFVGKKATTLYVTLVTASGREAEVRLGVSSTILSDIVLNPGTVEFGVVGRGQTPTQTLTIDRVGMPSWQVKRMVSASRAIDATLTRTARDGESVSYLLKVSLRPDVPAGNLRDEIRFHTNDPETPSFAVPVTASVRGDLSASPSVLALGNVTSSGGVQGRFLLRASRPFVVRAVEGEGDGFKAVIDDTTARPVHLLTIAYRPEDGSTRGDLRRVFRVHTDLIGEPMLELTATLHVEP